MYTWTSTLTYIDPLARSFLSLRKFRIFKNYFITSNHIFPKQTSQRKD